MKIEDKNRGFGVKMAFLREGEAEKSKKKACDVRETEKFLKNCLSFNPICAKHAIFATQLTRE